MPCNACLDKQVSELCAACAHEVWVSFWEALGFPAAAVRCKACGERYIPAVKGEEPICPECELVIADLREGL